MDSPKLVKVAESPGCRSDPLLLCVSEEDIYEEEVRPVCECVPCSDNPGETIGSVELGEAPDPEVDEVAFSAGLDIGAEGTLLRVSSNDVLVRCLGIDGCPWSVLPDAWADPFKFSSG